MLQALALCQSEILNGGAMLVVVEWNTFIDSMEIKSADVED